MIDTKKEQERDELHRAIWAIADELRGAVDGWDFKNYVLGTMFYRYIRVFITGLQKGGRTYSFRAFFACDTSEKRNLKGNRLWKLLTQKKETASIIPI